MIAFSLEHTDKTSPFFAAHLFFLLAAAFHWFRGQNFCADRYYKVLEFLMALAQGVWALRLARDLDQLHSMDNLSLAMAILQWLFSFGI